MGNRSLLLLWNRVAGCSCRAGVYWKRVNHLARARVVQLLASLVLDRVGIALQPVNVPLQGFVFSLQVMQLTVKALCVLPFLLVHGQAILTKDDVVPHSQRKQGSGSGRDLSPADLASPKQPHEAIRPPRLRAYFVGPSHLKLSTNFTQHSVKWKSPFT
jgi:hypothetical protein